MKKYVRLVLTMLLVVLIGCSPGYVATRPPDQRYARSVSPGSGYVWVTGEWEYRSGKYHWQEGSWQPARRGHAWKPGYWESNKKGYRWHKGYWQ